MDSNQKKALNVDSPSFTPTLLSANGTNSAKKPAAISPKAANAAVFLPKSIASSQSHPLSWLLETLALEGAYRKFDA